MVAVTAAWNKPLPSRILLFALFFCYERKIGGHGLMASGKVRCPAALDFPETDGSVPVNASYMPVECPFGSDMDVKTIPSGDFKEHSSRDPFPVQEFLFLFIEQQLMLLFPRSALFRLFLFPLPAFLFLLLLYASRACVRGAVSSPRASNTRTEINLTKAPLSAP